MGNGKLFTCVALSTFAALVVYWINLQSLALRQNETETRRVSVHLGHLLGESSGGVQVRATRKCTHRERVKHLTRYCDDLVGYPLASTMKLGEQPTTFSSTKVFINPTEEYKYLWCEVSKAGCTTWQRILRVNYKTKQRRAIKRIDSFFHAYDDHFKFINIRHPLDRLLSAYYNAIRKNRGDRRGPGWPQLDYLAQLYDTSNHNLTLTQFLAFLVSPSQLHAEEIYFDRHWDSYARSCKICSVAYDYVLRTETSLTDSKPVLELLGYPQDYLATYKPLNQNPLNVSSELDLDDEEVLPSDQFEKHLAEFAQIDQLLLAKVYDRYRLDFEAFGYHFDYQTNTAYCAITLPNGDVCC